MGNSAVAQGSEGVKTQEKLEIKDIYWKEKGDETRHYDILPDYPVTLYIETTNYNKGDKLALTVKDNDGKLFKNDREQIRIGGRVDAEGILKIEDFCVSYAPGSGDMVAENEAENKKSEEESATTGQEEEAATEEENRPKILDAYFVKWNPSMTAISSDKIGERGLSYQVAIVVETENLTSKKIKVRVKSGKRKVLSDVDAAISFIDMADVAKEANPKKYKDIAAKAEFEAEVDAIEENKAVVKLMLNGKANDLSFDLAKLILADEDKTAFVYIEVDCDEPDVEYEGQGANKNTFLNDEGSFFQIKYLEQPWIVKAREEYEKKICQANDCQYIVDNYHAVNREHKPSSCTDSWCASFVGWCLDQAGYSAQLDPGAAAYANIKTRIRWKTEKGKKVWHDKYEDPVWGQTVAQTLLGCICHVKPSTDHVAFAVAQDHDGNTLFLGGNQSNSVRLGRYTNLKGRTYPVEYVIKTEDYELPVYYVVVPQNGSITAS